MRTAPVITLIFLLFAPNLLTGQELNICEFGAVPEKNLLSTSAIQAAIDSCTDQGGGIVRFPPGEYQAGTIYLKDNVTLFLDPGAILYASTDTSLFPLNKHEFMSRRNNIPALIHAEGRQNIGIRGGGTIHGQGHLEPYHISWKDQGAPIKRPKVIHFVSCSEISIDGVTLRNSPHWMMSLLDCENIRISNVFISNRRSSVNNDGIDLDCCRNAVISNCIINSEDDAIVLKSTSNRVTENVAVTNCVLSSHCNAFKLGTETNAGFRNISFSNSVIFDTYLTGIALEIVDGGEIDGISISNISMRNVNNPLFLKLGNRAKKYRKDIPKPGIGSIKNIMISNVQATGVGGFMEEPPMEFSHTNGDPRSAACIISGLPENYIENVTLRDFRVSFTGIDGADFSDPVPENPRVYPEFNSYGPLPAYALYSRHVQGLTLVNFEVNVINEDLRVPCVFDDVKDLFVDHLSAVRKGEEKALLSIREVKGADINIRGGHKSVEHIERREGCEEIIIR